MSPGDARDEMGRLLADLCDGQLAPADAARLEQLAGQSDVSRQLFLDYLHLEGELYWEHSAGASDDLSAQFNPPLQANNPATTPSQAGSSAPAVSSRPPGAAATTVRSAGFSPSASALSPADSNGLKPALRTWAGGNLPSWLPFAAAALLLAGVTLAGVLVYRSWTSRPGSPASGALAARVVESFAAEWDTEQGGSPEKRPLVGGDRLALRAGWARVCFAGGAEVIVEGPARLVVESASAGSLERGRLSAHVPPEAAGFALHIPSATVIDLGTEFGLSVDGARKSEVHVFAGRVELEVSRGTQVDRRTLEAGHAVRLALAEAGLPAITDIALAEDAFVRSLPSPGSVAAMRLLVSRDPRLIHHYTFEGRNPTEQSADQRGDLPLTEAVMLGGRGDGRLEYAARGLDPTTLAVRPFRAALDGNTVGVGLQTAEAFFPPPAFTVELLLNYAGSPEPAQGAVACAVATRSSRRQCGFFVAAADQGQLVHLMDGDAPWTEADLAFTPGDWYYVACTFQSDGRQTRVNSYAADLSRSEAALRWVVRDQVADGVPAASRLGIGKGFDANLLHAYPWPGLLDEVAIYDAALDRATLESHLRALLPLQGSLPASSAQSTHKGEMP